MDQMTSQAGADAVLAAEQERCRAISEQDWAGLELVLDPSLTHTHMNGRVDDRDALVAGLRDRPRALRRGPLQIRVFDDCAVVTGAQYLDFGGGEIENQATGTWIRRDSGWQLVAFHASGQAPLPG